ncbi:AAA family ATPase, partial [Chloroflexota bacterium]
VDDVRRLRAIAVSVLENAAQSGSTLMITNDIVRQMNAFRSDVDLQLNVSDLTLHALDDIFRAEFLKTDVDTADDNEQVSAFQLNRFVKIDDGIRSFVQSRIGDNIEIKGEWDKYLNKVLKSEVNTEHEQESRSEKLKAIEIMAKSTISVLTGGAGTGKTTTLAALCLCPEIQQNGIIVLAPTGKARVVLDTKLRDSGVVCQEAFTIFQFLQKTYHCDWKTYRYYLSGEKSMNVAGSTVIIDECSMLTEEMLGALAETLELARRVIFVGDPNQLPPIGMGKPFFELAEYLREKHPSHYAKLTISNRQKSKVKQRLDVELAKLFTYDQSKEVGDDVFSRVSKDNENIEFVPFTDDSDIQETVQKTLAKAAGMRGIDDIKGFDESLGGRVNGEWMNFTDVKMVDNWQILSPYRNDTVTGSATINRHIHERYRVNPVGVGFPKKRRTKHPLGNDGIIFGEKVINIRNQSIDGYPSEDCPNYVANGDVGIVERIWQRPKDKRNTHQVRFTSQSEYCYNWASKITDSDSDLELAYALTVHKAQGSGFGTTIFVINEPPKGPSVFISREMIYTALSRQANKIFILYNKPATEIKKYADALYSDLARRLTNLFEPPTIRKLDERYYADRLIHITRSREKVRSKSEVIIANELDSAGITFEYERKLVLNDGKEFIPDFTVFIGSVDQIYWEHLGMLSDGDYRKKWEYKKSEYAKNSISEEHVNLIVTEDNANGGIDSSIIAQHVKSLLDRLRK